ncbi:conserved hypothetical protein [Ricinus communis]|uniref:Uncharacterized protein n=1 Tax=Ricinus communis TaxID=3988 RepID=B9RJV2_RICCO|nr:conserved hypothetical protein [Ricinus communis]
MSSIAMVMTGHSLGSHGLEQVEMHKLCKMSMISKERGFDFGTLIAHNISNEQKKSLARSLEERKPLFRGLAALTDGRNSILYDPAYAY